MTALRPLLKWPGGKTREWAHVAPFVPADVRDFLDPFMGGCAPFALTPFEGRAYLNDRHERLVDLHLRVQAGDAEFLAEAESLARAWQDLAAAASASRRRFEALVEAARRGADVRSRGIDDVAASLEDKAARLARLEAKHGVRFDGDALAEHCETAVRAAFYTRVRAEERTARGARAAACFLFVREYCYGSMFRSNAEGAFNIPYGGRSYNRKSFLGRVRQLRAVATRRALARATFSALDFEEFLARRAPSLGSSDFVFADPPYDSDFSTYGDNAFSLADHERLAAALARLPCRWLLVIKETPEVARIYSSARRLGAFGKTYGYNVRGRNERDARHLLLAGRA